ncbi:MAG: sortase [Candidatus Levybacteria bacterium]|nr:sortase [Candidatus Levybacteria bacterium]
MKRLLSKVFIASGIALLLFSSYLFWQRNNPNRLAFATEDISAANTYSEAVNMPTSLTIPSIQKTLPVIPMTLQNSTWSVTPDGVSYLSTSPLPGNPGNSILYGHNWPNLLGKLVLVKPGDSLLLTFKDGKTKQFTVQTTQEVSPSDTSVLKNTPDRRLTLYTCSGFLDSKRFVVTAVLVEK